MPLGGVECDEVGRLIHYSSCFEQKEVLVAKEKGKSRMDHCQCTSCDSSCEPHHPVVQAQVECIIWKIVHEVSVLVEPGLEVFV